MGKLIAINISEKRGTEKKEIQEAQLVTDFGIAGDAHAGKWHRQVSLLSFEKIEDFKARGARIENGAFGENLIVSGFDFKTLPLGTRFQIGDTLLEMTQIGKQCHSHCAIYQRMGECIMPKEGVFAVVLKGGTIKKGDEVTMIPANFYATVRDRNKAADIDSDRHYRKKQGRKALHDGWKNPCGTKFRCRNVSWPAQTRYE